MPREPGAAQPHRLLPRIHIAVHQRLYHPALDIIDEQPDAHRLATGIGYLKPDLGALRKRVGLVLEQRNHMRNRILAHPHRRVEKGDIGSAPGLDPASAASSLLWFSSLSLAGPHGCS